ncbi:MAG: hypothetical protein FJ224_11680 [Lentisphaerae bacterium]|nr:hypothetical protein [Lentisphaerota bacterium]
MRETDTLCAGTAGGRAERRRGVALILTLGLLFIVLVIAFGFAISMHIERGAATAHYQATWARQAIFQPMSIAQREIQHHAGIYPDWAARKPHGPFESNKGETQKIRDMVPLVTNYLPAAAGIRPVALTKLNDLYWYNLFHIGGAFREELLNQAGIWYDGNPVYVEDAVCATLLANCSGLLDIHVVGRTNRLHGTSPAEIQVTPLRDGGAVSATRNITYMESFPELRKRAGRDITNFFHYSHFPVGEYWSDKKGAIDGAAYVGGDPATWKNDSILASLDAAGIHDIAQQGIILTNMMDYVDADFEPRNLNAPSQEPVPGFNEISVKSSYTCERTSPTQCLYTLSLELHVELFSGYLEPSASAAYTILSPRYSLTPRVPNAGFANQNRNLNQAVNLRSPVITNIVVTPLFPPQTVTATFLDPMQWSNTCQSLVYDINFPNFRLAKGSDQVDRFASFAWTITNALPRLPALGETVTNANVWARTIECLDPRFNWDINNTAQWRGTSVRTPNSNNTWTVEYMANPANETDPDTQMYSANARFRTVGELAYIVYAPWQTIRICSQPGRTAYHSVLDTFTLYNTNVTKAVRGLINPNTEVSAVLDAAFYDMPIGPYPGATGERRITVDVSLLADAIQKHVYVSPGAYFRNVSDLGGVTNLFHDTNLLAQVGATNEFLRESILRNSAGLFNTRQQLYTIFLVSSYVPEFPDDFDPVSKGAPGAPGSVDSPGIAVDQDAVRVSERRAVIVFWRDAWTGDSFTRFFKWVDPSDFE